MKRLNKIGRIEFIDTFVLIDEVPLNINENIIEWLKKHSKIDYSIASYIEGSPAAQSLLT